MSECVQTEALTHQTMPWTGAGERRTVFFKYSPKALTWSSVSFSPLRLLSIDDKLSVCKSSLTFQDG